MDIRVLGPVEASAGGKPVFVGAGKPRALLALLALNAGSAISTDRLVEGLWGEEPPATAAKMVQLYVSQLRKALAAGGDGDGAEIVTRGRGYELRLGDGELDARRFEKLVAAGAARDALSLWRGAPLADVADEPFAAAEIRRLDELRVAALELAVDGDLAGGRHREVVGELDALVAEYPLRERLHAQRMLALYRCGRQAEALDAYRRARSVLVEEIGVEPGPELRRLHEAILRQDRSLERPTADGVELPPELDAGTPLAGREAELDALREQWRRAHGGAGRLVLVVGPRGMGKTRLAAELAGEVHRDRGAVLYASGAGATETTLAALASGRVARRPTLLAVDDVDRAGGETWTALGELAGALAALPVLVLATTEDAGLAAGLRADATIVLAPLDADGVRAVARLYAGEREDADIPVERLAEASGGVPQRLHRAAGEWARTRAIRRLTDTADRVAAERPVLRAAEDDMVGNIVELQAARDRAERWTVETDGVVACPFKGLASFDVDDAGVFFGRERLVAEMVARLTGAPLMGIVGPSGSGKSSALRAGLLAALAAGVLPGSERWAIALLRPGEHPLRALEQATAEVPPRGRLVIAVDQFEEIFTACREESERAAFVDALIACARDPRRRALVLVAVRADFYGRCAAYPGAVAAAGRQPRAGRADAPRRAASRDRAARRARRPARRARPDRCADRRRRGRARRAAAALDVAARALAATRRPAAAHERLRGRRGRARRGRAAGRDRLRTPGPAGPRGRAHDLPAAGGRGRRRGCSATSCAAGRVRRRARRRGCRGLGGPGRRPAGHDRRGRGGGRARGAAARMAAPARLAGGRRRGPPSALPPPRRRARLGRWRAATPAELYRGARLATTLEWIAGHEPEVNDLEREFVGESRAAMEVGAERQRRVNQRLRALLASVAVLLALAVVAGAVALSQRGEARDAALVADAQRLGAEALSDDRLDHALLLARAGVDLHDSAATRGNLLSVLQRSPAALGVVRGDGWPLYAVAVSPDERLMAIGDQRGTVTIYDRATRRPLGRYRIRGGLVQPGLRFSPDGSTLAVPSLDPRNGREAVVDLIDPLTRKRRLRIVPPRFPAKANYIVSDPVFLPNGRDVAIAQLHNAPNPDGPASVLRRFDGRTGVVEGRALRVGRHSATSLSTTADRRRLFMTSPKDDATYMIDARTLRLLQRWPVGDLVGQREPGRAAVRSRVGGRRGPPARPALRTEPAVPRAPQRPGPADEVHA